MELRVLFQTINTDAESVRGNNRSGTEHQGNRCSKGNKATSAVQPQVQSHSEQEFPHLHGQHNSTNGEDNSNPPSQDYRHHPKKQTKPTTQHPTQSIECRGRQASSRGRYAHRHDMKGTNKSSHTAKRPATDVIQAESTSSADPKNIPANREKT